MRARNTALDSLIGSPFTEGEKTERYGLLYPYCESRLGQGVCFYVKNRDLRKGWDRKIHSDQ